MTQRQSYRLTGPKVAVERMKLERISQEREQAAIVAEVKRMIRSALARFSAIPYNVAAVDTNKSASRLEQDVLGERAPSGILDSMKGSEFILSVKRAGTTAADAVEALDEMTMWAKRLQPYFEFDPEMTVAQALELYLRERRTKSPQNATLAAGSE